MGKQSFTLLIFRGAHGKLWKLRVPLYAAQLALGLALVGTVAICVMAGGYAQMLFKVSVYNVERKQDENLKNRYGNLETIFAGTYAKLASLQSLAAEVAFSQCSLNPDRPGIPRALMVMATEQGSTPEASFHASFFALDALKAMRLVHSGFEDPNAPSIWPVRGRVTAGFGQRMDPLTGEGAFHAGIDIAAPSGTAVLATADGILFHVGPDSGYGIEIWIDHGYGISTRFGHLSKTFVVLGQEVRRGQVIGAVGMTGRATGPHLHYEVRVYERPVNPAGYLPESPEFIEAAYYPASTDSRQAGP